MLLAATVRSFALMPLGISDRNNAKTFGHNAQLRHCSGSQPEKRQEQSYSTSKDYITCAILEVAIIQSYASWTVANRVD